MTVRQKDVVRAMVKDNRTLQKELNQILNYFDVDDENSEDDVNERWVVLLYLP